MILSAAEKQLIRIIRAARGHDLTLTVRVRDRRHTVRMKIRPMRSPWPPITSPITS
jgi:hypothetical protein